MPESKRFRPVRLALWRKQKGICHWCGEPCFLWSLAANVESCKKRMFTVDHVTPRSEGGKTHGNVVGACYRCNQARNTLLMKIRAGRRVDNLLTKQPALREKLLNSIRPWLPEEVSC